MGKVKSSYKSQLIDELSKLSSKRNSSVDKGTKLPSVEYSRSPWTGQRIYKKRRRKPSNNQKNIVKQRKEKYEATEAGEFSFNNNTSNNEWSSSAQELVNNNGNNDMLQACITFLQKNLKRKKKKKTKTWFQRSKTTQQEWENIRPSIWKCLLEEEHVDGLCGLCNDKSAIIRCGDCNISILCQSCDSTLHEANPYHNRLSFINGYLQPLSPLEVINDNYEIESTKKSPLLKSPSCCALCQGTNVESKSSEEMCIVITLQGRFDLNKPVFCCKDCNALVDPFNFTTILKSGYWPGSPVNINYLIKQEVFEIWDVFRKRMPGSSERSFLLALSDLSDKYDRSGIINSNAFGFAFKEWNYWKHKQNLIQQKNWLHCPPCEVSQHSSHVDGNCKLYRYKRGVRKKESFYGESFICSKAKVDAYVNEIYKKDAVKKKVDDVCGGSWSAAKNLSRKMKSLDETGLEVATCRHRVAQKALNMYRGEIFGYPLYLIKEFMLKNSVKFFFADVACKLWPFIMQKEPSMRNLINPGLSVFHAKGHSDDCQVLCSGDWLDGTARTTGEETEQFFSFISRSGNVTKHQTPDNREETITEMTLGWNQRKITNIVPELKRRYEANEVDIKITKNKIDTIKAQKGLPTFESDALKWVEEIKSAARGIKSSAGRTKLSNMEKIVLLAANLETTSYLKILKEFTFPESIKASKYYRLLEFSKLDKQEELTRLESIESVSSGSIKKAYMSMKADIWAHLYQKDIEKLFMEKTVWCVRVKKAADTSKRRHIIRGKQAVCSRKLKDLLMEYSVIVSNMEFDKLFELCDKGLFPWRSNGSHSTIITCTDKRLYAELFLQYEHCLGERALLLTEMENCFQFFYQKANILTEQIQNICQKSDCLDTQSDRLATHGEKKCQHHIGERALLKKGLQYYSNQIKNAVISFKKYLKIPQMEDVVEDEPEEVEDVETDGSLTDCSTDIEDDIEISYDSILSLGDELSSKYVPNQIKVTETSTYIEYMLPHDCCQSRLAGAEGSNACVIISLLMGYMVCKSNQSFVCANTLVKNILPLFCGAVSSGNDIYTKSKETGYLNIDEGLLYTPFNFDIVEEKNPFISNSEANTSNTLEGYLKGNPFIDKMRFLVLIVNERAVSIFCTGMHFIIIDSHENGCYGGKITVVEIENFEENIFSLTSKLAYSCLLHVK